MTQANDPAFPFAPAGNDEYFAEGMTFRQYAAVHAMQGLLAGTGRADAAVAASIAVGYADALIARLALNPKE